MKIWDHLLFNYFSFQVNKEMVTALWTPLYMCVYTVHPCLASYLYSED